jgi:hypothetical protein
VIFCAAGSGSCLLSSLLFLRPPAQTPAKTTMPPEHITAWHTSLSLPASAPLPPCNPTAAAYTCAYYAYVPPASPLGPTLPTLRLKLQARLDSTALDRSKFLLAHACARLDWKPGFSLDPGLGTWGVCYTSQDSTVTFERELLELARCAILENNGRGLADWIEGFVAAQRSKQIFFDVVAVEEKEQERLKPERFHFSLDLAENGNWERYWKDDAGHRISDNEFAFISSPEEAKGKSWALRLQFEENRWGRYFLSDQGEKVSEEIYRQVFPSTTEEKAKEGLGVVHWDNMTGVTQAPAHWRPRMEFENGEWVIYYDDETGCTVGIDKGAGLEEFKRVEVRRGWKGAYEGNVRSVV